MENYVIEIKVVKGTKYTSLFRSLFKPVKCLQIHSNFTEKQIELRLMDVIETKLLNK